MPIHKQIHIRLTSSFDKWLQMASGQGEQTLLTIRYVVNLDVFLYFFFIFMIIVLFLFFVFFIQNMCCDFGVGCGIGLRAIFDQDESLANTKLGQGMSKR